MSLNIPRIKELAKEHAKKILSQEEFELLKNEINKTLQKDNTLNNETKILQRKLFDYCTKENWNLSKIEEKAKELDITTNTVKKLALAYAKEILDKEEYTRFYRYVSKTISSSMYPPKGNKKNYPLKLSDIMHERIYDSPQNRAETIITAFINDSENLPITLFCKKSKINILTLTNLSKIIAETNPKLYAKYCAKIALKNNSRYSIVKEARTIIMYLKTEIEEYGIIRPFDIIDYHLTTKVSLKYILNVINSIITKEEYNLLKTFVDQNLDETDNNNQIFLEGKETIQEALINFLVQNKIPINQKTYFTAYNRYIKGTLDLNTSIKSK